jgi:hypothetical protein
VVDVTVTKEMLSLSSLPLFTLLHATVSTYSFDPAEVSSIMTMMWQELALRIDCITSAELPGLRGEMSYFNKFLLGVLLQYSV